jgi:superfamily II DNA/RNA helicase
MSNLRFLAIDETDRMIEKGHFEELEKILKLIKRFDLFILILSSSYL